MSDCREIIDRHGTSLSDRDRITLLGSLDLRVVLLTIGKQELSIEGKVYTDLAHIGRALVEQLSGLTKTDIPMPPAFIQSIVGTDAAQPKTTTAVRDRAVAAPSVEEMCDPVFIAAKLGFKPEVYVRMKDGVDDRPFKIVSVGMLKTKLVLHDPVRDATLTCEEDTMSLKERLKLVHGTVQTVVPQIRWLSESKTVQCELIKGKYLAAIIQLEETHKDAYKNLRFLCGPNAAYAVSKFQKGKLVLPPTARSLIVSQKVPNGAIELEQMDDGQVVSVAAVSFSLKADDSSAATCVVPYSFVEHVKDENIANMKMQAIAVSGVSVPCMVNSKMLEIGDKLQVYKRPADKKRAAYGDGEPAQPKKKGGKGRSGSGMV
jgi:hypothetical protein